MPAQVLAVADHIDVLMAVKTTFDSPSYRCMYASTFDNANRMIVLDKPDVIIVDSDLARDEAVAFLKGLRASMDNRRLPILFVSADTSEVACILALEAGAHDYLRKPLSSSELLARVRVALRPHLVFPPVEVLSVNGLTIVPMTKRAFRRMSDGDVSLRLTPSEFQLLHLFLSNPYKVFSREEVIRRAWKKVMPLDLATVDVHVFKIRRQLKKVNCSEMIETVPGSGYRLVCLTGDPMPFGS